MVLDDNLKHLKDSKSYLYINALDKDQLTGVEGFKPERFKNFTEETTGNEIFSKGLTKYDDNIYYEDLGVNSSSRGLLIFSTSLCLLGGFLDRPEK